MHDELLCVLLWWPIGPRVPTRLQRVPARSTMRFQVVGGSSSTVQGVQPGRYNRYYLGTSVHTGDCALSAMVRFQPKLTTTHKILRMLDEVCQSRVLTRDLAGRLRGDLNWMYSMCAGFGGKLAGPFLSKCQQADSTTLFAEEIYTLEMLRHLVANYRPREVPLLNRDSPVLRGYSDASFEGGELRLGWVLFPPGCQPVGGTCLVPPAVLQSWNVRQQQTFPGESLWTFGPMAPPQIFLLRRCGVVHR